MSYTLTRLTTWWSTHDVVPPISMSFVIYDRPLFVTSASHTLTNYMPSTLCDAPIVRFSSASDTVVSPACHVSIFISRLSNSSTKMARSYRGMENLYIMIPYPNVIVNSVKINSSIVKISYRGRMCSRQRDSQI